MLIITTIEKQPDDFQLIAQNMTTYEICGYTEAEQDDYAEIKEIPAGFEQRVLPGRYGKYLTLSEMANLQLIENGKLKEILDDADMAIIEQYEIQVAQDASIIELYEMIGGI